MASERYRRCRHIPLWRPCNRITTAPWRGGHRQL